MRCKLFVKKQLVRDKMSQMRGSRSRLPACPLTADWLLPDASRSPTFTKPPTLNCKYGFE